MSPWWALAFLATVLLTALTVAYLRHDPATCAECARRRQTPDHNRGTGDPRERD